MSELDYTLKRCSKCDEEKHVTEFNKEVKRKDGLYPWCKQCLSYHRKARYSKTPRKVWLTQKVCSKCKEWKPREDFRKYPGGNLHYRCISCEDQEQKNTDNNVCECSACGETKPLEDFYKSRLTKQSRQCIACHKAYHSSYDRRLKSRDLDLKKFFGISLEEYKELLKKQDHRCPICLEAFKPDHYSYPVDHAHAGPNAGVIRAILHDRCNRFVMWKHTDPDQLRRAADLIENPLTDVYVPEEYVKGRPKPKRKRKVK